MKTAFLVSALAAAASAAPTFGFLEKFLTLDRAAKLSGRFVGTATDKWILDQDPAYRKIAESAEFSQVTAENTMKWETIEPQPGVFNFTAADELVKWAQKHNKKIRGHTLVWHSQLAPWVEASNFTSEELKFVTKRHVQTVARHFRGKFFQWDVVNEAFEEDGSYRQSIFYKHFGEDYIEWAFRWAREADPYAKLYINDYNFEAVSPKTEAVTRLVKKLKAKGVPIDGIGAQGHLILGQLSDSMVTIWKRWSDELKVDVSVTELDIRLKTPGDAEEIKQQAKDYKHVVDACTAVKRCKGITLWQFTDKYSWIPGVFTEEGEALPWDENLNKKPAYDAMLKALLKFW